MKDKNSKKEIQFKMKEESKKEEEESELEEEIKEEEKEIKDEELQEFFEHPIEKLVIEKTSPSLEKINISSEVPIRLEQGLANAPAIKEEESIKYGTEIYKKEEEPKYQAEGVETFAPKATQIEELGKQDFFQKQNIGLIQPSEIPKTQEEYMNPKSQKIEELGRNENPFEIKTIKYEPPK